MRGLGPVVASAAAACVVLPAPAAATFPGLNGRIAYAKSHAVFVEGGSDDPVSVEPVPSLFTLNPHGSMSRLLARNAEEPSFSPGGSLVSFEDYFRDRIFIKPTAGGPRRALTPAGRDDFQSDSAWSPSAETLILVSNSVLHRVGRDGTAMHRLRPGLKPDWSVRNRVVFDAGVRIATMAPGGGRLRRLREGDAPCWSPDGRWIAFVRTLARGRSGVAIMRADGSRLRTLTRGPWDDSPVWSPDGRQIAYVHRNRRTSRERIVLMRTGGKGHRSILTVRRGRYLEDDETQLEDLDWQPLP